MATLTQLETNVGSELGLDYTGADKTLLDQRLNQAVRRVLLDTMCYVTSATMSESAGAGDYTLDSNILRVVGWQWSGTNSLYSVPQRTSVPEILRLRSAAQASSTTYPASFYAVSGSNLLMVYPTPAAADTITIYYVPKPTEMSSASHDPSSATYGGIPVEYHDAIEFYALWRLASFADDSSSAQGERYHQLYDAEIKRIRKEVRWHGGAPPKAVANPRRRRLAPHDPSSDI